MGAYIIVIGLLNCVACGAITRVIALRRNAVKRSWFFIGFFLGEFGVIWAIISERDNNAVQEQTILEGTGKKCPFCAEVIKLEANVCRFCGRDLPESVKPKKQHYQMFEVTLDNNTLDCPLCKTVIHPNATELTNKCFKCPSCNVNLKIADNALKRTEKRHEIDESQKIGIEAEINKFVEVSIQNKIYYFRKETADTYHESIKLGFKIDRETTACKNCGEKILLLDEICNHCKDNFGRQIKDKQIFDRVSKYVKWKASKAA